MPEGPVSDTWILLALAAGGALMLSFLFGEEARIARKVILQFFFTIALPVLVLLAIPLYGLSLFTDLNARLWQALIAGLVIATGWLTTAIFNELAARRIRAEKLRDYHKALYAEIQDTLSAFWGEGESEGYARDIQAKMDHDPHFVPFIPRESHDRVFTAMLDEIEVLPRQTIDAIVAYYSLISSIAALADDMRGDGFKALEQSRRILMYRDYLEMRQRAYGLGVYALKLIDAFAKGGASAAEALTKRLNTPGGDRNGLSQGSG